MLTYSIITPTGDRQRTISLCSEFIKKQTTKPKQWIVVDDGNISSYDIIKDNPFLCYIKRQRHIKEPNHTLPLNFLLALEYISSDVVFIFEDDDYYSPVYCEKMLPLFDSHDLIGHDPSIYYHVKLKKYMLLPYRTNISLYCSAFNKNLCNAIKQNIKINVPFIDRMLWNLPVKKIWKTFDPPLCAGLKGLEGRQGRTSGHNLTTYNSVNARDDFNSVMIKKWMGDDFSLYKGLL